MASKKFYMVLDTETANGIVLSDNSLDLSQSLVYDIGFTIVDRQGRIYDQKSMAIREIFCGMSDIMKSAYYCEKIPKYWEDIKAGRRELVNFLTAYKIVRDFLKKYDIHTVSAHNARFDVNALNNTIRYITKSRIRYFFPYQTEIFDTMKGARNTICKQTGYIQFCEREGYMTKHKTPRVRATAEILYKYLTGDYNFTEEHQGLDDCLIEGAILTQFFKQHKKLDLIRLYA